MKSKYDRFVTFLTGLGASIVLTVLTYLLIHTRQIQRTGQHLDHLHEMLHLRDALLLNMRDIESSRQGYLQTHQPTYQRALHASWTELHENLVRMEALAGGAQAGHHMGTDTLRQAVQGQIALIQGMPQNRFGRLEATPDEREALEAGRVLGERVRTLLDRMSSAEFITLAEEHSQNSSAQNLVWLMFAALVLLVVLVFFLVMYALRRLRLRNLALEATTTVQQRQSRYAIGLIEASVDPLIVISREGRILDTNQAAVHITGVTRTDLIGSEFKYYFTDPDKAAGVYEEIFERGVISNYPLTVVDGKLIDVSFNGSVYRDDKGAIVGAVVLAHDLTEQKRVEKELTEALMAAELATGLAEEAKLHAENAIRTAEQAVRAKQQFLSNMSHEIRTPMNAIIGFTKVMLKTNLSEKQKEYLTAIRLSGDSLIVLINDILDLAKVDAGKMVFEQTPFKIVDSLSAMLRLFEPKIEEKNLRLSKVYDQRIPEVLLGDPARLHQIILNLVSNAVKFTNNGKITVTVELLEENAEQVTVRFSVADTGIGISEIKLAHIFENFEQASSSTSRVYGGTGLGLAIVKQLVEKQGGLVHVVSEVDVGSTFSFILSFLKTDIPVQKEPEIEVRPAENRKIKVLVVEDITLNQLLMKTLLDDFGFERDVVANGKLAIAQMETKDYDIILMDLQMPEMNGFEATEYIRNTLNSQIPIIALTADVTTADLKKCTAVGMNDYIAKPVDERILYRKILKHVRPSEVADSADEGDMENSPMTFSPNPPLRCINLDYLNLRTKSNPVLMKEMIRLYLQQTPLLVYKMKECLQSQNWVALQAAVHRMIPSFSIVGIDPQFEQMAKRLQDYANIQMQSGEMQDLAVKLERVCMQACSELEIEFHKIQPTNPYE